MIKKNLGKRLVPTLLTFVALLMGWNLFSLVRETSLFKNWRADFDDWREQAVCVFGEKITDMLAPAGAYLSESHADSVGEWLLTYMKQIIPAWGYYEMTEIEEKQTEFSIQIERMGEEIEVVQAKVEEIKEETKVEEIKTEETILEENEKNEGEVTVWQDGNLFYYQPSSQKQTDEAESQEVFLGRLFQVSGYSLEKLRDFDYLMRNFFSVRETTSIGSNELQVDKLLSYNMKLKSASDTPQIYIYHTHSQEEFCDYVAGETGKQIVDVGTYLSELLSEKYGYYVIHDKTPYDMKEGVLDKNEAYTYAGEGIEAILSSYPSIEVIIDLHRDGVAENVHLVTEVNGKPTAKMMFVNGISRTTLQGEIDYLYNPYIEQNIAFSFQLQLVASGQYPELVKRTMISAYRYNLHYREKSLLVEVGAQTNTSEEAMNAMEPLAEILDFVLSREGNTG